MASPPEATLPATRKKSRKSIAHLPSAENKENMTEDVGDLVRGGKSAFTPGGRPKKSRSKSIGPGGLDALTDTTGNRRKSTAMGPPPRSILKPTMPLLPLPEIPARGMSRRPSPTRASRSNPNLSTMPPPHSEDLIDFRESSAGASMSGTDKLADPFQTDGTDSNNQTRVLLRSEEEQQAAAREREKQAADQDLAARREARRKSLANRRVSFAPEATLHTWDIVESAQDSTASSASTNSTRRASSHSQADAHPSSEAEEAPSTPPEQVNEAAPESSPTHQRELHQKKRRRSSGIPPMNFNNPDEGVSSSPYTASSVGSEDVTEVNDGDENEGSPSGSDDGTMMSIDEDGDSTAMSIASAGSSGSSTLERNLRLAGTRGLDSDEYQSRREPEPEDDEIVASFKPWSRKAGPVQNLSSMQDQENINPFSPAFKAGLANQSEDASEEDDATMEVTRAVGGIIRGPQSAAQNDRRQSLRRRSSGEGSSLGDETMDLTMAFGGIQTRTHSTNEEQDPDHEDEDMTMEFTTAVGGVMPGGKAKPKAAKKQTAPQVRSTRRRTRASMGSTADDDEAMDMTTAVGRILPVPAPQVRSTPDVVDDDATMEMDIDMDMTTALGRILPNKRAEAKRIMELEVDAADPGSSPFQTVIRGSPPKMPAPSSTMASETGSPNLAPFRGRGLRRSDARKSSTPKSTPKSLAEPETINETPLEKASTPSKKATPARPTTPGKTPPSRNIVMRNASPKRLFEKEIQATQSAQSTPKPSSTSTPRNVSTPNRLFQKDSKTGMATPSIIFTPNTRRLSGVGADKPGIGSPRITALLDRRASIGDSASVFSPQQYDQPRHNVRFEDPRSIEIEVDLERAREESRENGRSILEREVNQEDDEKDATINLKEMIESLTPKKYRPLKGRKSLHVGAAKGILGKRPAELDDDDEDDHDDQEGVNRLKNHQDSPLKKIKLHAPPSKEEMTSRMTRSGRKSTDNTAGSIVTPTIASSPAKPTPAGTPQNQGRFKDMAGQISPQKPTSFDERLAEGPPEINEEMVIDDRVHLQDFLNMTSIRFMELTTTKRRHTVAPSAAAQDSSQSSNLPENSQEGSGFERCVVAGACTVPMLELFQHSCRELKKYISEGRSVVREIETVTFEENPPLFQEYISASPEIKTLMDNQFKIVKTHARLLSKGMWYEWRMKLLDGLRDGLYKIGQDMNSDRESLQQQQELLDSILPSMIQKFEQLEQEESELRTNAEELANCDQEELSEARNRLLEVDNDIEAKKKMIADMRSELEAKDAALKSGVERKQACQDDIKAAEKTREECRGWSAKEVSELKAKVDKLEKEYGWTVTGCSGNTLSMSYKKEIELVFDATAFKPNKFVTRKHCDNSPIDLWYIAADREQNPLPKTPEKDFFLANIRDHIRGLPQCETSFKDLLTSVSSSWLKATTVIADARFLNLANHTQATKTSDSSISFKSTLLLRPLATKVMISFALSIRSSAEGFEIEVDPEAKVAYGERFNEPKMKEFLISKIGTRVDEADLGKNLWGLTVASLEEKLLARGKK